MLKMNDFSKYDDNDLICLIKEKNPDSNRIFHTLYSRYSAKLNSYCRFISHNQNEAEEIFQDTWIKFYKSLISGIRIDSIVALLYTIARNTSTDKYRKNKNLYNKKLQDFDLEQIADQMNFIGSLEKDELMKFISMGINSLSDKYKETFVLYWFSGLSYSEIAEITGETIDCIRKRCYRAMSNLIDILQPIIIEIS